MSEHPTKEQEVAQQQHSERFAHAMAVEPAVLVNGFSLSSVGRMAKMTFTEGVVQSLPPYVRANFVLHPEDLAQLVAGAQQLLDKMQEAGMWTPPVVAQADQD